MQQSFSFTTEMWKRLKKNKGALFGLVVIILAVLIAVLGYLIAPDNSPNADLQTVEIQARKPGYTQLFLKIPDKKNDRTGWFTTILNGKREDYRYLPITYYLVKNDSLVVNQFIDEDTTVVQSYSIASLTNSHPDKLIAQNIVTKKYWLGTDKFGRDILSRFIICTRLSLSVGLISVRIVLTLGFIFVALAGFYG